MDWKNSYLPASVCGGTGFVQVRDGGAIQESTRWRDAWAGETDEIDARPKSWVELVVDEVHYGDLDGDGREDAAIDVGCTNGGGMAGGQLAFASVILRDTAYGPTVLGIIESTQPDDAGKSHVPIMHVRSIGPAKVIVDEAWYGPHDGTCCATGKVATEWDLRDGALKRGVSIVKKPVHE